MNGKQVWDEDAGSVRVGGGTKIFKKYSPNNYSKAKGLISGIRGSFD